MPNRDPIVIPPLEAILARVVVARRESGTMFVELGELCADEDDPILLAKLQAKLNERQALDRLIEAHRAFDDALRACPAILTTFAHDKTKGSTR